MAYNPFNIFRRNQKAIFAVITVFIMFTFVLSSGLGGGADFFDWLNNERIFGQALFDRRELALLDEVCELRRFVEFGRFGSGGSGRDQNSSTDLGIGPSGNPPRSSSK